MRTSTLRKIGVFKKAVASFVIFIASGVLGFLFPPLWIVTLCCPFFVLKYAAQGQCPVCGGRIEVKTRRGGAKCKQCGARLLVAGLNLSEIT